MPAVEKRSVSLSPELAAVIDQAVAGGEFGSASEVIREALRQWKDRRELHGYTVAELRRLWDEGIASGPSVDGEEVLARLRKRIENRPPSRGA